MKKGLLLGALIGVAVAGLLGYLLPSAGATPSAAEAQDAATLDCMQRPRISVSGTGEVTVVPDVAILSLGVEAEKATVQQAMDEAAAAMDKVVAALRQSGVAEKDIQTRWFSVYQTTRWKDDELIVTGYRVSNTLTASIRDVDATGRIIDAVADAGGDLTRIQGVSFTVDDPTQYYAEARARAVADARARAQQLADLGGVKLGKPFTISEVGGYMPTYYDYDIRYSMAMDAGVGYAPETYISPGETEVSLTVYMDFALE